MNNVFSHLTRSVMTNSLRCRVGENCKDLPSRLYNPSETLWYKVSVVVIEKSDQPNRWLIPRRGLILAFATAKSVRRVSLRLNHTGLSETCQVPANTWVPMIDRLYPLSTYHGYYCSLELLTDDPVETPWIAFACLEFKSCLAQHFRCQSTYLRRRRRATISYNLSTICRVRDIKSNEPYEWDWLTPAAVSIQRAWKRYRAKKNATRGLAWALTSISPLPNEIIAKIVYFVPLCWYGQRQ